MRKEDMDEEIAKLRKRRLDEEFSDGLESGLLGG